MDQCPNEATYAVPWQHKIQKFCNVHTNGILGLGRALGVNVFPEKLDMRVYIQCEGPNDLHEYEKARRDHLNKEECKSICGENPKNHYFNCPLYEE